MNIKETRLAEKKLRFERACYNLYRNDDYKIIVEHLKNDIYSLAGNPDNAGMVKGIKKVIQLVEDIYNNIEEEKYNK